MHFTDASHGHPVGHDETILSTVDGGETWTVQRQKVGVEQPLFCFDFDDALHVIAAELFGPVLVTADGGRMWHGMTTVIGDFAELHLNHAIRLADGRWLVIGEAGMAMTKHLALPIVDVLAAFLKQRASQGVFRADVNPVKFYITLAGFNHFDLSNQPTLSAVLNTERNGRRDRHEWLSHMEAFIFPFLLRNPAEMESLLESAPVSQASTRRTHALTVK